MPTSPPCESMLALYWRLCPRSVGQCAELSLHSLLCLRGHGYTTFYRKDAALPNSTSHPIDLSPTEILTLLQAGVHRDVFTDRPFPELGYSLDVWSGNPEGESYSVVIRCACAQPNVGNCFVVHLPAAGPFNLAAYREPAFAAFHDLVKIWKPDEAIVCDRHALRWGATGLAAEMRSHLRHPVVSANAPHR